MIRILFLSANPINTAYLENIKEYKRSVDEIILSTKYRDEFRLDQAHEISLSELLKYLERFKPNIVHFTGHGSIEGELVFQNSATDKKEKASITTIEEVFRIINVDKNIKCVVLSACYSKSQADAISNYVPCVIGMSAKISLDSASAFNVGFYSGLGNGYELQRAIDAGRLEIKSKNLQEENMPQEKFTEIDSRVDRNTILVEGEILARFYEQSHTYGFELLTNSYFEDHKSSEDELDAWKNGSSFTLSGIKSGKALERKELLSEIKSRVDNQGDIVLQGGHGTSKRTLLMQLVCSYLDEGYKILYNEGADDLRNARQAASFIESILNAGYKLLIAVHEAHNVNRVSIFHIMERLKSYKNKEMFKFLVTASIPETHLLLSNLTSQHLDDDYQSSFKRYFENNPTIMETPYFTRDEIQGFLKKFKPVADEKSLQLETQSCYQQTRGHPSMVKFFAYSMGATEYVNGVSLRYLTDDIKCLAALVCLLIDMAGFKIRKNLLTKMELVDDIHYLDHVMVTQNPDGYWETLNPKWNIEFLSGFFATSDKRVLDKRIDYFRNALERIFQAEDQELTYSVIDSIYTVPLTNEILLRLLSEPIKLPDYLSDDMKHDLLTLTMAQCYSHMGRPNLAIQCLDGGLKLKPKDQMALYNKSALLRKSGRYNDALECLDEMLIVNPEFVLAKKEKASYLYKLGRYHDSEACFLEVTDEWPEDIAAWNGRGISLNKLSKYPQAIECFDHALKITPGQTEDYNMRGIILFNKGSTLENLNKYPEAKDCFLEALKMEPKLSSLIEKGDRVLSAAGLYEDLVQAYEWLSYESHENKALRLHNKCSLLENSGRIEDALDCYDRVIKIDPRFLAAWNAKGAIYGVMGKYEEAEKCFGEVITIEPSSPIGWANKGRALEQQGKDVEALEFLNEALKLDPSDKGVWNDKAQLLIKLKDPKYGSLDEAIRKGGIDSEEQTDSEGSQNKPLEPPSPSEEQLTESQWQELLQDVKDIKKMLIKFLDKNGKK